jgi:hypothetical protein
MLAVIDDRADRKTGIDRGVVAFTRTIQPSKRNQDAALFFGARVQGSNWILSSRYWRVWAFESTVRLIFDPRIYLVSIVRGRLSTGRFHVAVSRRAAGAP